MQSKTERIFHLSKAAMGKRHFNALMGALLAIALCSLAVYGHATDSNRYNEVLLVSIVAFIALFGLFNLAGHIRYFLKSRKHHLEVGEDRLTFVTGDNQSVLMFSEVAWSERQSRRREGPSLMVQLKNKRIVRLVGYEHQKDLSDLVTQRIARVQSTSPGTPT